MAKSTTKSKSKRRKFDWSAITETIKTADKPNFIKDDGYSENLFTPQMKDDGTYEAIIRFLPRREDDGDGVPFVKLYNHGFQTLGGQWFIENCPTTIGGQCPVCKANSIAWKAGDEDLAKSRARRQSFFANILIVKDPQKPENEGKVFIFRYGKKIHEKIMEKMSPSGELDESVPIFDYDIGMNFKLKIKTGPAPKKFKNYDSSQFTGVPTAVGEEEYIEQIESMLFPLQQIVGDDKFKSFEDLENIFKKKIGEVTEVPEKPVAQEPATSTSKKTNGGEIDSPSEEDLAQGSKFFEDLRKEDE